MTTNQPMASNCPACGAPLDYRRRQFCDPLQILRKPFFWFRGRNQPGSRYNHCDSKIRQLVASGNLQAQLNTTAPFTEVTYKKPMMRSMPSKLGDTPPFQISNIYTCRINSEDAANSKPVDEWKQLDAIKLYRETFDTSMERALNAIKLIENGQGLPPENDLTR